MARPIQPVPTRRPPDRRVIAIAAVAIVAAAIVVAIWALAPGNPGVGSRASVPPSRIVPRETVILTTPGPHSTTGAGQTLAPGATPTARTTPDGPTNSGPPVTSTEPLPPGAGLAVNWSEAPSPGFGVVQDMTGAAYANGRVVVIGDATDEFLPGIWASDEGRTWQAANFPDSQSNDLQLTAVTAGGPGFVAFAQNYDTSSAIAYASSDGLTWQRSDDPDFEDQFVFNLDSVGSTVVAASDNGILLTSTDGINWNPATDVNAVAIAEGVMDFASYNGTLYAFVIDFNAPDDQQPISIWSTQDAVNWTRLGSIAGTEGVIDASVAIGAKGMVVLSEVDQGDFFGWQAWQSADGVTWQPAVNTPSEITDVIADQSGFVAVGSYNLAGGCAIDETENVGTTWTSADGLKWRELSSPGWVARQIQALGFSGRTLVGVGIDWNLKYSEPPGDSGRAWTADLPDSATDDAPPPAPTPEPTPLPDCGD
jgi:hypothetical protein